MFHQTRRQFLTLCATGVCGARLAFGQQADAGFTFAVLNDCHIKDVPSVAILDRAIAQINADVRVKAVIVAGDVATAGAREELDQTKAALAKLQRPWHILPGNHDVFMRDEDIYANYTAVFGPVHWVHEYHGWTFIGFNSCDGVKSDVSVADTELAWLREQWSGKLVVKGIQSVADARRVVDAGADALVISNHGGRQLDGGRVHDHDHAHRDAAEPVELAKALIGHAHSFRLPP